MVKKGCSTTASSVCFIPFGSSFGQGTVQYFLIGFRTVQPVLQAFYRADRPGREGERQNLIGKTSKVANKHLQKAKVKIPIEEKKDYLQVFYIC